MIPQLTPLLLASAALFSLTMLLVLDRLLRRDDFPVVGLIPLRYSVGVVSAVIGVFRNAPQTTFDELSLSPTEVWIGRLSTLLLLGVATLIFLRPTRQQGGRRIAAFGLTYVLAQVITSALSVDGVEQASFMLGIFMLACFKAGNFRTHDVALWIKRTLAIYMWVSVAVILVGAPGAAEVADSSSLIPGLNVRLSGIAGHPNLLGPLAVLFVLFEGISPSSTNMRRVNVMLGGVLVLGAQSKTAIGAALIIGMLLWWRAHPRSRSSLVVGVMAMAVAVPLFISSFGLESDIVSEEELERYRTLTNRTSLWDVSIEGWQASPVIGQGPLYFKKYARDSGLTWAGHAHNQVFQELPLRGLVGLFALCAYVAALWRVALRHSDQTSGMSVALITFVSLRMVTQVPFESLSLEHAIVFAMAMAWERETTYEKISDPPGLVGSGITTVT